MLICVLFDGMPADEAVSTVLAAAPRVALDPPRAWLDVRGLDAAAVHSGLRRKLRRAGAGARYGAGGSPVVAQLAAQSAAPHELVAVPESGAAEFVAAQPLAVLGVPEPLLGWLADVGIGRCGELAAVAREAVEVRFGAAAVAWWRLARGVDERRLFRRPPAEQPVASVDFMDYVVTDPERLLFTTNALLGGLCEQLQQRGMHARQLRLRLPLANGAVWERTLKSARPTADRAAWLRLARGVLERITVPDSVAGVGLQIEATTAAAAVQGDLFDAGFATAGAVEGAVARLLEDQGDVIRAPVVTGHALVDTRSGYRALTVREALALPGGSSLPDPPGLTLQLLPEPKPVVVESSPRRDHAVPVRYHDERWHTLAYAAGPDRVSGGQWEETYAREYFRAVTDEGTLVWLFRDACADRWYLHGWWD